MVIIGVVCGILNYALGLLLILPFMAIPVITLMAIFDESKDSKHFGVGYGFGVFIGCLIHKYYILGV